MRVSTKMFLLLFVVMVTITVTSLYAINRRDHRVDPELQIDQWSIVQATENSQDFDAYQDCVNQLDEFTTRVSASVEMYRFNSVHGREDAAIINKMKDAGLISLDATNAVLGFVIVRFDGYYTREDTSPIVLDTILSVSKSRAAPMTVSQTTAMRGHPTRRWTYGRRGEHLYFTPR